MQRRKWNVCARTAVNVQKESHQAGCMEEVAFEAILKRLIRFKRGDFRGRATT